MSFTRVPWAIFVLGGLLAMATPARAANPTLPAEMRAKAHWVGEHLRKGSSALPFAFTYGGSRAMVSAWPCTVQRAKLDADREQTMLTWRDPRTGLEVRCVAVDYRDYPAVGWTVWLKNNSRERTPILESIRGLDVVFGGTGDFVLHGIKGDWCDAHSYEPYELKLDPRVSKEFFPPIWSGKSCDGPDGWPYFNLQVPGGGMMIAVGWPGEWSASFAREGQGVRVRAGQKLTHLYLEPGEEIRTPLIALVFWDGTDVARAQNLWRRWYVAHTLPKWDGKPQGPLSQIQVGGGDTTLPELAPYAAAGVKPDICWRDAGGGYTWYPSENGPYKGDDHWLNTGTWDVDPAKYPRGFKPYSDAVRAKGMQFLLWFEPERVGDPNSWLGTNHPEWLLPGESHGSLLDEGNPQALAWLIHHIDGMIHSQGLDWYREDMNGGGPRPSWKQHDAPERQGITENLYVQGHLKLWDTLLQRNPGLRIDSCASGGRRNDLETMRRAVPLLRSDFQFPTMPGVVEGNQGHTYGLSSWLPWYGSGVWSVEPYIARSFLMPGFGTAVPADWDKSSAARAALKRAYDEAHEIGPLMLADYYPLTPYSLALDHWIAWQFNRPEQGDGCVQAFRRAQCDAATLTAQLHGLDPRADYLVTDLDTASRRRLSGATLIEKGLEVELKAKPAAALIMYRRL